jgi:hypothetical protein
MADKDLNFDYGLPSRTRRLLDFFTFGIFKRTDGKERIYVSPERVTNAKKSVGRIIIPSEKFPTPIQKMLDKWSEITTYNLDKWEGRKDLVNDLLEMYYNSPIVSKAMNITVDEVLQADSNNQIIGVEGNKRQVDYINRRLDDWGISYKLRDIAFNIVLTGDYGLMPKIGKTGIEKVSTIEPLDLQDIFEFRPIDFADLDNPDVQNQNNNYLSRYKSVKQVNRIDELINAIKTNADISDAFDRHTLGYMIKDQVVPPWGFIHFRNFSSQSPFKPFGLPPFIHCLAPFRQLQLANQLQMSARASRFPIQRFKIKLPNIMMPTDKLEKAIEFINELDNSGFYSTKKETPGVGERLITIDELFEVDLLEYNIDLGRIDDIEALRDDLMNATLLPKSVVDPNVSGLGASGVSLVQQFKPFSRFVYGIQSVILEGLTKLIQIDMILSNSFSDDEMDFILTMPFPESQTDRELIGSQSDLIQLANTMLDILGQRFYGDPSAVLPQDLVKSVLTQILPYDKNRLDDWIELINAGRKVMEDENEDENEEVKENTRIIKKMDKAIIRESIAEAKVEAYKSKNIDYSLGNKHYHRSVLGSQNNNFDTKILIEMKKNKMKAMLKEEAEAEELENEEMEN